MESKRARLSRRLKRAESIKKKVVLRENSKASTHRDVSNHEELMDRNPLSDISNRCPALMSHNNQIQSQGKEKLQASQFSSLYSHRKENLVLNDISNCVRNLAADLNQARSTDGYQLANASVHLPQKRKRCSDFQPQSSPVGAIERGTHVFNSDIHVINQHQSCHLDTHLICDQSQGKEKLQASQFSSLYSHRKENLVLNDISNCDRNLAADLNQSRSTDGYQLANASVHLPQKRKRCSDFQPQSSLIGVTERGTRVFNSDIHFINQRQSCHLDTHLINDVHGQDSTSGYDVECEVIEDGDTNDINYSDLSNLHMENIVYFDLGNPDWTCTHCGAIFWHYERVRMGRPSDRPIYSMCCSQGKVQLPFLSTAPTYLMNLIFDKDCDESRHFKENIRAYNMMFSFTSMGGRIDNKINDDTGRFVYRLSGQNHHRIGSLLPMEGQKPKFAQLYIYDTANEVNNRLLALSTSSVENGYRLDPHIIQKLKEMVDTYNPIAKVFRIARDRLADQEVKNLKLKLIRKRSKDSRIYNLPTVDEIAALVVGDIDIDHGDRDIIVETQSGQLQRIHELHPLYLPMQYPLLFPYGEDGFSDSTPHSEISNSDTRRKGRLTLREFFAFRIQERKSENGILLHSRRLFQQFVVDAYTMIESHRLSYIRSNQKLFRQDIYKGLSDAMFRGETQGCAIGKRIVLPSSFTGGARYLMQNYQDAMAICKWAGYPDIFITFTCNPKWLELTRYVNSHGLKPEDRPDIIARIFKMKLKQLMEDVNSGEIFGPIRAVVYTIEFQKRGLPHCHILLFLYSDSKHAHPEDIDKYVCAEIPDPISNPQLYEVVQEFMLHGPCGPANPKSPCMIDGRCSKFYPKEFTAYTKLNEDGYPMYRRRDNGRFIERGHNRFDNRHVVPYNPKLLLKYHSHINVEWCNQGRSIKYLFKDISKGNDRVTVALYEQSTNAESNREVDEIKCYYDCRYISPCEAMWRIYSFEINYRKPAVERLNFHLPDEQTVVFQDQDDLEFLLEKDSNKASMFTAWMEANKRYPEAKHLTYIEFPSQFVYKSKPPTWLPRKKGTSIGRLKYVAPIAGELFYLSILLQRVKGPENYAQIRTVGGIEYGTFRDACYKLGLLDDDQEFIDAIKEASLWGTGYVLRSLFVTMLLSDSLSKPEFVWEETWRYLSEDMVYHQRRILQRHDIHFTDEQIKCLGLFEIEKHLRKSGKSLKDYPTMPQPDFDLCSSMNNTLIVEQLDFDKAQLADEFKRLQSTMTIQQKNIFDIIISAVDGKKGGFFFVNGYGGTGKTFLWRALTAHLRSRGQIVLCVASSGIAATLLPLGRTAHSRYCILIPITEYSTCNIKQGSFLAELIIKTSLIIWDEAPMVKKHCFEALDRTLRDLMQKVNPQSLHLPFGGKCLVLGGDFRQILPVIPTGTRSDIVFASINSSYLWSHCHILTLSQNMRLQQDNPNDVTDLREFSEWMLKVGDGKISEPNDGEAEIEIPESLLITDFSDPLEAIFDITYPAFDQNYSQAEYLKNRAILTPTLDVVEEVNEFIINKLPGQERTYLSSDSISQDGQNVDISSQYITPSMLNELKLSGLPNHKLILKVGVPIMLLRNLDQSAGLCNGTRLIVTHLGDHVIVATVISGGKFGHQVYLPRMNLTPSDSRMPFKLQRRQFPISISYCMTINKSQGQSLSTVTVYFPKPVFTHGQLYVAVSRVKSKKGLKLLILDKDRHPARTTKNVVYKEIFQNVL